MAPLNPDMLSVSLSLDQCFSIDYSRPVIDILRDFVDSLLVTTSLQGLLGDEYDSASGLRFPQIRRSSGQDGTVRHLDTISSWRDLPQSTVVELKVWYHIFGQALRNEIIRHLKDDLLNHIHEVEDSTNVKSLIHGIFLSLHDDSAKVMNVDMELLVREMLDLFYADHPSQIASRNLQWAIGTSDVPSFVYNFIRLQDCFFHVLDGPCVAFKLQPCKADDELSIKIIVSWRPPKIQFTEFDTFKQKDGECQYSIVPQCNINDIGSRSSSNFKPYEQLMEFEVARSSLPLQWHEHGRNFEAAISTEPMDAGPLKSVILVKNTVLFPGGVRFHEVSRFRVVSELYSNSPSCKFSLPDVRVDSPHQSPEKRKFSGLFRRRTTDGTDTDVAGLSSVTSEDKRRKISLSADDTADEVEDPQWLNMRALKIMTGRISDVETSIMPTLPYRSTKAALPRLDTSSKQYRAGRCGVKHTTFPWDSWNRVEGRSSVTPPTASTTQSLLFDALPTLDVPEAPDSQLSQEEIQRNYQEFEERSRDKAAERAFYAATIPGFDGVISPTEETDDVMENVFLDDDHDTEVEDGTEVNVEEDDNEETGKL